MSGPKVVRIVTREEIIELCKDHLAQLEAAVRRWETMGNRNDLLSDDDIKGTRDRQDQFRALLAADKFGDVQKQVPEEIIFLKSDMERRLSEAASRAVSERTYGSRLATLARQTLERSTSGQLVLTDVLKRELQEVVAANGTDRSKAEKALADVRSVTIASARTTLTAEQRAHADRLKKGDQAITLEEWVTTEVPEADPVARKVEQAIQELAMVSGEPAITTFADRHRGIAVEQSKSRRQMLADTLMLDVGRALASARVEVEQFRVLELQSASLSSLDTPEAQRLVRRIAVAVAEHDTASLDLLSAQAAAVLEQDRKRLAAKAQWTAIVSALQELGYEVREGMQTAAPQDGKVILRRAANPEMGVEVAGMQGGGRVQFRPVRFGSAASSGDRRKDRDIETIWCSDFDRLHGSIGAQGTIKIEQAAAVGTVPVLFVDDGPPPEERRPEVRAPAKTRPLT